MLLSSNCSCFSGLPDEIGFDVIAERFRKFNIHGLLIIGGFDVSCFALCDEMHTVTDIFYSDLPLIECRHFNSITESYEHVSDNIQKTIYWL